MTLYTPNRLFCLSDQMNNDFLINVEALQSAYYKNVQKYTLSLSTSVQKCVVVKHHAFITNSDASNKLQVSQTVQSLESS